MNRSKAGGRLKKEIPGHYIIKSADQMRALGGPVRMSLFKHLSEKPWTAMALAKLMKVNPTKLYYHLNTMEKHGLIKVLSTSKKRNFTEKTYRAVAQSFKLDDKLLRASKGYVSAADEAMRGIFDATERDVEAIRAQGLDPFSPTLGLALHGEYKLSAKDGKAFQKQLLALMNRFGAKQNRGRGEAFCLSVVYYPKGGRPLVGVPKSSVKKK
jgi:DNA-binding HxlR family transcriptional regulator